ncbi:MAG: hypothetical protein R6V03_05015 [Kiritimatiellia bacterium]
MEQDFNSETISRELRGRALDVDFSLPNGSYRYREGDVISATVTRPWPEEEIRVKVRVDGFAGGGFAGQVYRCTVLETAAPGGSVEGLAGGATCALKIYVPPTRGRRLFRDFLYGIGFQGPFSRRVNRSAARFGALWQKVARLLYGKVHGSSAAVADIYGTFYDERLGSYGEIREWVEGRTWRLEPDTDFRLRRRWKKIEPDRTRSPEYVAKRQFMFGFARFLRLIGASEFARQYEWWTAKSQPNVLKREDAGDDPAAGLCAMDFTPGLVLLPFLPMSPADVVLIVSGLFRGSLVQFDRQNFRKLRRFISRQDTRDGELEKMIDVLEQYDRSYRLSLPDIAHRGPLFLFSRAGRRRVREGFAEGYRAAGLVDENSARVLERSALRFAGFRLLGLLPLAGTFFRRLWGCVSYRRHVRRFWTEPDYFRRVYRARMAGILWVWHRSGKASVRRVRFLERHPCLFWLQRFTVGLLPGRLHLWLAEPSYVAVRVRDGFRFVLRFYRDAAFRENWLKEQVLEGYSEGMLNDAERDDILKTVSEPFIAKYLKCLAVHFATLPVTQIVSVVTGGIVMAWLLLNGAAWATAVMAFVGVFVFFQIFPVSPGSICRGAYVVYLMKKEKNYRDYLIAAPLSFVKYLGYLAFPIQMVARYPALSRFMAARWAASSVRIVPVFGERGALLEHFVFDAFFNVPRIIGRWACRRPGEVLSAWMLAGTVLLLIVARGCNPDWSETSGINLLIAYAAVFAAPRIVFYPLLSARFHKYGDV